MVSENWSAHKKLMEGQTDGWRARHNTTRLRMAYNYKGTYRDITVSEAMVLVSAYCQIMLNICTKFHENTSDSFNVIKLRDNISILKSYKYGYNCKLKITNGSDSKKNVGGNMAPVLCTTDNALYLYQNSYSIFME